MGVETALSNNVQQGTSPDEENICCQHDLRISAQAQNSAEQSFPPSESMQEGDVLLAENVNASLEGSRATRTHNTLRSLDILKSRGASVFSNLKELETAVGKGLLVPLPKEKGITYDTDEIAAQRRFVRPIVRDFLIELGSAFAERFPGKVLTVTSATREKSYNNRISSFKSDFPAHSTGYAVDLRSHLEAAEYRWLSNRLIEAERNDEIEALKENHPEHFHIVVYPDPPKSSHHATPSHRSASRHDQAPAKPRDQQPTPKSLTEEVVYTDAKNTATFKNTRGWVEVEGRPAGGLEFKNSKHERGQIKYEDKEEFVARLTPILEETLGNRPEIKKLLEDAYLLSSFFMYVK
ncbi:MAG: hypothetical protein KDD42_04640 [Bdellovibrionales bacterium]|nr:hypothetical protein [Bdellovibrionales bacterium]